MTTHDRTPDSAGSLHPRREVIRAGTATVLGLATMSLPAAANAASTTESTSPPVLPAERPSADLDVEIASSPERIDVLWVHNAGTAPFTYTYTVRTYPFGGLEANAVTRTSGTLTSVGSPSDARTTIWTNDTGVQQRIKVEYSSITSPAKTDATGWNVINA